MSEVSSDIQTDSVPVNSNLSVFFNNSNPGTRIHEAEMLSERWQIFKNYKGISSTSSSGSIPKYREYEIYDKRLESFAGWPLLSPLQKPSILAHCGFFYIGSADRARCFHCGLTLRDWDDDDFPPVVHKEWAKNCEFTNKLDVDEIRKMVEAEELKKDSKNKTNIVEKSSDKADNSCFVKSVNSVVTQATSASGDSSSSNYVYSPTIQAVLEMGYSTELIQKSIDNRKRKDH